MVPKEEVNQSQRIDNYGMRKYTSSLMVFEITVGAIGEQEMKQLFVTEVLLLLLDEVPFARPPKLPSDPDWRIG
jgi:hypothetical protein